MTTPIRDEDVEITIRVQPVVARAEGWRGHSSGLIAVGLVGFIVVGVILGTAFDDAGPARPVAVASPPAVVATASPTARPAASRSPRPSPLPSVQIIGGRIPTERRFVYADGLEVLDLATGTLLPLGRSYEDLLFPAGNDEVVCACLSRVRGPHLRFGRFDLAGQSLADSEVLAIDDVTPVPDMTEGFNVVGTYDGTSDRLFVMVGLRRPPVWTIELFSIDAATGDVTDQAILDTIPVDLDEPASSPSPSPLAGGSQPDGVYAWAEAVTASTDGSALLASESWAEVRTGNWTNARAEWMIPIHNGRIGDPVKLTGDAASKPDTYCVGRPAFVDPVELVTVCSTDSGGTGSTGFVVKRLTSHGESLGDVPIPASPPGNGYPTTAIDRQGRRIFVWDLTRHELARIGVDDGEVVTSSVPLSMLRLEQRATDGQGYFGADPGIVLSPDGTRLFALGTGKGRGRNGSSTGVWVFDANSLELVDHWEPRALLTSLAISGDGQFVYAIGAPGLDVLGNEVAWLGSVTVYDAMTGEVQVLYGSVGSGNWLYFPSAP